VRALRQINFSGLAFIAALLVLWQAAALSHVLPIPDFPTATATFANLWAQRNVIGVEALHTVERATAGFFLAIVTMIPLGVLVGRTRWLGDAIEPVIDLLRPLPVPAIAPLVMLLAGIGDSAKILIGFYAASFPILLNAIDGARNVHPMFSTLAKSLRLTSVEALTLVYLPASFPQIMAGIRTSAATSFLTAVTAEMLLSTNGIGVYLLRSQERYRLADGLAGILTVAVLAFGLNQLFGLAERRLLRWHVAMSEPR
jgi:ABC-type nitrate/sulfonate/bicarbonate transport system permease component